MLCHMQPGNGTCAGTPRITVAWHVRRQREQQLPQQLLSSGGASMTTQILPMQHGGGRIPNRWARCCHVLQTDIWCRLQAAYGIGDQSDCALFLETSNSICPAACARSKLDPVLLWQAHCHIVCCRCLDLPAQHLQMQTMRRSILLVSIGLRSVCCLVEGKQPVVPHNSHQCMALDIHTALADRFGTSFHSAFELMQPALDYTPSEPLHDTQNLPQAMSIALSILFLPYNPPHSPPHAAVHALASPTSLTNKPAQSSVPSAVSRPFSSLRFCAKKIFTTKCDTQKAAEQ